MTRLLMSAAALAMLASPALAEAKKPHPAPAKHKMAKKTDKAATTTTTAKKTS